MNILQSIFDDETIQRQTLKQERMKERKVFAKNLIRQGKLSIPEIASCSKLSIKEVEYVAQHIDEIEEEEAQEEMLLVS